MAAVHLPYNELNYSWPLVVEQMFSLMFVVCQRVQEPLGLVKEGNHITLPVGLTCQHASPQTCHAQT